MPLGHDGGDPEDTMLGHGALVLGPEGASRAASLDDGHDLGGGQRSPGHDLFEHRPVAQIATRVVAGLEQRHVDLQEGLAPPVSDRQRDLGSKEIAAPRGVVPHVWLALANVDLVQREGPEGDLPRRATSEPGNHLLVNVAGEGTAIVEGDGELERPLDTVCGHE
jgi:hypothetical protein